MLPMKSGEHAMLRGLFCRIILATLSIGFAAGCGKTETAAPVAPVMGGDGNQSTLKGYAAGNASMKTAMSSNTNMKSLDAKIAANADLTAKLKAAGFTPNDVVAASTDASGGVTLFVNDGK